MFRQHSTKKSLPSISNIASAREFIVELAERNEELISGGAARLRQINIDEPPKQLIIVDGAKV